MIAPSVIYHSCVPSLSSQLNRRIVCLKSGVSYILCVYYLFVGHDKMQYDCGARIQFSDILSVQRALGNIPEKDRLLFQGAVSVVSKPNYSYIWNDAHITIILSTLEEIEFLPLPGGPIAPANLTFVSFLKFLSGSSISYQP